MRKLDGGQRRYWKARGGLMTQQAENGTAHESFDPLLFERYAQVQDRHFWFQVRNRIIATLIGQAVADLPAGYRVLEVGCGTGIVLRALQTVCPRGEVCGMDLYEEALAFTRQRLKCKLVQGDITQPPQAAEQYDAVGMFDVLEHLEDDALVLRHLWSLVRPGGVLLLTVPAMPQLWSYFDVANHHCRRYTADSLSTRINQTGFQLEYLSYFMSTTYPLIWVKRRFSNLFGRRWTWSDNQERELLNRELSVVPVVNTLLRWLLAREVRAIRKRKVFRWGSSLVALARKPLSASAAA